MFTPSSKMPSTLQAHLRYPEDIFGAQAAVYGRYHITTPSDFYTAGDRWSISPTAGVGPPSQALAASVTTNSQGQVVTGPIQRMSPLYQVLEVPGQSNQTFNITEAYVPYSASDTIQTLSGFLVGGADPGQYGKLHVFITPSGKRGPGPAYIDSLIQSNSAVSSKISLLNQNGSSVLLGNVLMIPLGQSMLYVRPLYVSSNRNELPTLQDMIAVFGHQVALETTLDAALTDVFKVPVVGSAGTNPGGASSSTSTGSTSNSAVSQQAEVLLNQAAADYAQAKAALKAGNLGGYQSDIQAMAQEIAAADQLLGQSTTPSTPSGSPPASTTTTHPASKSDSKDSGNKSNSTSGSTTPTTSSSQPSTSPVTTPPSKSGSTTTTTTTARASAKSSSPVSAHQDPGNSDTTSTGVSGHADSPPRG